MRIIISFHIQPKILQKSHVSTIFSKKLIFAHFHVYFQCIQISEGSLTLYEVTVTSYEVQWYSFWYLWIEKVHTYTLVANIGVSGILYRKSREGLQQPPSFGGCVTKLPQEDEGQRCMVQFFK